MALTTGVTVAVSQHISKRVLLCFLLASLAFLLQPLTASAQGTFSVTGSMTAARNLPTATLLPNGKVLIAGGGDSSNIALASAELFDPATGTFSATGSMSTARFDFFTATLLSNGKVLVAGGNDGSITAQSSAELYDPTTGTFTPTGSMSIGRYNHTATLLANGKVLIAAGCNAANGNPCQLLGTAELYDPAAGTFSATGSLMAARAIHTATRLYNGKVLVAGGADFSSSYISLASAELYDPATGTFSATGSMIAARAIQSATLLASGQVLVATGYDYSTDSYLASAELYSPATGSFSAPGAMTTGRIYQSATLLGNGEFLVAGGFGTPGILASAELYSPTTGTFNLTGSMNTARLLSAASLLPSGQVLVAGGSTSSGISASAELYTPRKWRTPAPPNGSPGR
jgi:hypothetical protein